MNHLKRLGLGLFLISIVVLAIGVVAAFMFAFIWCMYNAPWGIALLLLPVAYFLGRSVQREVE